MSRDGFEIILQFFTIVQRPVAGYSHDVIDCCTVPHNVGDRF